MDFFQQFIPIAAVVVICAVLGMFFKWLFSGDERKLAAIPWILALIGGLLGILAKLLMPEYQQLDIITAFAIGIVSGLASCGAYQIVRQQQKIKEYNYNDRNRF